MVGRLEELGGPGRYQSPYHWFAAYGLAAVLLLLLALFPAPPAALEGALTLGLALPFLAGLWGVRTIYVGFLGLADTLAPERRGRRTVFLRRLTMPSVPSRTPSPSIPRSIPPGRRGRTGRIGRIFA